MRKSIGSICPPPGRRTNRLKYPRPRLWLLIMRHLRREQRRRTIWIGVPDEINTLAGIFANEHAAWVIMRRLEKAGLPVRVVWLEEAPEGSLAIADPTGRPAIGHQGTVWVLYTNYFKPRFNGG
jgi:hypothetical protein